MPAEPEHAPSSWGPVFSRLSAHSEFDTLDNFVLRNFHAAYIDGKPCKSAGLSDLANKKILKGVNEALSEQGTKADTMRQWDDTALCKFTTLRILAFALAPLEKLRDGIWLLKNGLLSPHQLGGKHEPTRWNKVQAPDGKHCYVSRPPCNPKAQNGPDAKHSMVFGPKGPENASPFEHLGL